MPQKPLCLANYLSVFFMSALMTFVSCSYIPKNPRGIENACNILNTDNTWREAFDKAYRRYGAPPHVVMAIIYQESRFVSDARPPRKSFLGIPTTRPSTAFGFAQALDKTWAWYQDKSGNSSANRENIADAVDFIGWYIKNNHERTGTSKWDAKNQYFAYHEGSGGFLKKTHTQKPWLLKVAEKVNRRSQNYRYQLQKCYRFPPI